MAKIAPLRAVIYNQKTIKDISSVTCPPYDVIAPERQEYYRRHPHNLIHILLSKDVAEQDKYAQAGACFNDWLRKKIFVQDENPAIYFYGQQYTLMGQTKNRLGFIARMYLQDDKSCIFCHEHTRLEPKEDRLSLLRAVKANLSPIFTVFSDKKRFIQNIYQNYIEGSKPFIELTDDAGVTHKVWRLDSAKAIEKIRADMQACDIFIADGHHRYEVACAYRDEMKKSPGASSGEAPFNYIMAYFTNIESSGLSILPIHRIVKFGPGKDIENLLSGLKDCFSVETVKEKPRMFFLLGKAGVAEHALAMYWNKKCWLLRLKNINILDKMIADKPKSYRCLDISILNYLVLKNILGLDAEDKNNVAFNHSADELIAEADKDSGKVAFFLNPVKIQQIVAVATDGQRMPSKSTFFYPKVLSGLLINKLE